MFMNPIRVFTLCLFTLSVFGAALAQASSPSVSIILPRGVQRGAKHVLVFQGARLQAAEEVFFYDQGIQVVGIEPVNANQVKVTIDVAADCRLGEHVAQLRTRHGNSEFRNFFVGQYPELPEAEPNNAFENPQAIAWGHTVSGIVKNEDVDYFQIEAAAGQRLSVEIEGIRLAGPFWDPYIAVLDENRFELAASDDSALLKQDGHLSLMIPADGKYWIVVRDSSYRGNDGARYRLHVGDFPRPTIVYPAGGKPGEKLQLRFMGDAAGDISQETALPAEQGFRGGLVMDDGSGFSPSPVDFRLIDLDNFLETEPNDARNAPNRAPQFPIALNGIIEKPNDRDYFVVPGKKGQVWDIECFARRLRGGLDPVINIFQQRGPAACRRRRRQTTG